jgi:hypothetical protein
MSDRMQAKAAAPKTSSASVSRAVRPSITPVRSALLQRACACGQLPGSGGKCEDCDKKEKGKGKVLQRASNGGAQPATVPAVVNQALSSPGRPLDNSTRTFMESRFGHDFGSVRVHNDSLAAESARAVNARAYTVGNDIVFDHGRYNPGTESGNHLLAHELAHTIQQGGVHRYANDLQLGGSTDSYLEREADSVAHAVLGPTGDLSPVPVVSRAGGPIVSRAPANPTVNPNQAGALKLAGFEEMGAPPAGVAGIRRFRVLEEFPLPGTKGAATKKAWDDRAKGGGLESILDVANEPRSVFKQERPATDILRDFWLSKVGWSAAEAPQKWKAAGGDAVSFNPPQAGGATCEIDHMIELQVGGTNVKENMQALDKSPNASSGATIRGYVSGKARDLRDVLPELKGQEVILHWDKVQPQGAIVCDPCCKVETSAVASGAVKPGMSSEGLNAEKYPINAGGSATEILITDEFKDKKKAVPIRDSPLAENQSAATLISGLRLIELIRKTTPHDIKAEIDTKTKSRIPGIMEKEGRGMLLDMKVDATGKLTLPTKPVSIGFVYPYLSAGTITKLSYEPGVGLSGEGTLTPSIPLLNKMKLQVRFSPTKFEIAAGLDPKKIGKPFPGVTITKAELTLSLVPFEPSGTLEFDLAPGGKKILDAQLTIKKSTAGGFLAIGNLNAYIPGVDKADGSVKYEDGKWSGFAKAETTQIKLPYVKSGTIEAGFNEKGPFAQGTVNLEISEGNTASVSLTYRNQKWYFSGKGTFRIPKPIDADLTVVISYFDGEKLKADGTLRGFKFKDLSGDLAVHYEGKVGAPKPRIWGEGNLKFQKPKEKPKVIADLSIKLLESGRFSGEGHISYEIKPNLVAEAGIKVDEHGKVTVTGQLKFPPYQLFKKFPDPAKRITIFEMPTISIPIPGASIGPIGLQARIDAGIYADYSVGPGEIRGGYVKSSINPFEENVDLDVEVGGQVYIPASFSVTGSVSGSVALDVKIASVAGGLTVSVTASLNGHVLSNLKAHYFKGKFEAQADFELMLALAIYLALKAFVKAEAGVWRFKVSTTKEWKLAEFKFDTGLKMGLKLKKPVAYSSETGFTAPSLDDIEWILPKFEPEKAVKESFSRDKGVANPPEPPQE